MTTMEYLAWLRDGNSDEIPPDIIHGEGFLKVRRNWWNGLVGGLEEALRKGMVPSHLEGEVEKFLAIYASDEFRYRRPLTTKEDIERANQLLDRLLGRR